MSSSLAGSALAVQVPRDAGGRAALRPEAAARATLVAVMCVNGAVVTALFLAAGSAGTALITIGRLTGLYGALVMAFQLLLIARLPWLDSRLGMDRMIGWHRWIGFALLWLLVGHAVFITFGYAEQSGRAPVTELVTLARGTVGVLRAIVAVVLIMAVGALSARLARRKMAYETWHFIHLYSYLAVVLAFSHQISSGQSFTGSGYARAYWWTLWAAALGAVLLGRVVLPLWHNLRLRLRVSAVIPESRDVVSVYITGRGLHRLPARAGQFFLWRFLTRDRWWQANPFSLSAAPDGRSLRLTAKALGPGSAGLRDLRPGTRVFAEGPYGAFTVTRRRKPGALLIAGGIGITPIRALLEDLRGDVVLIYRVGRPEEAVFMSELTQLARNRGATVYLLVGPPDATGPFGKLLGAADLAARVNDIRDRDVFLCGPPGLVRVVLRSLRELKIGKSQVHLEKFSLAS